MKYPLPAKKAASYAYTRFEMATFTIGAEVGDTINVAAQLKDARGNAVAEVVGCKAYLSGAATGIGLGTATTSAIAIGTNGTLLDITTTGKVFDVVTDASGRFDVNIIQTAAPVTVYLVIVKPDGGIIVSGAITFA